VTVAVLAAIGYWYWRQAKARDAREAARAASMSDGAPPPSA
jgi:hypothetical protein